MLRSPTQTERIALGWPRSLAAILIYAALGCSKPPEPVTQPAPAPPDTVESEKARLQGKWTLLKFDGGGVPGNSYEFTGDTVVQEYQRTDPAFPEATKWKGEVKVVKSVKEYRYKLDITTDPRSIDFIDPKGQVLKGIYRFTAGPKSPPEETKLMIRLVIRLARTEEADRPTSFSTPDADTFHSYVMTR